jgi:hypothetical protein
LRQTEKKLQNIKITVKFPFTIAIRFIKKLPLKLPLNCPQKWIENCMENGLEGLKMANISARVKTAEVRALKVDGSQVNL